MKAPNIYLIGFMATGKSSVARLLARRLKRSFLDTDADVEKTSGRSIKRIMAEGGEKAFRRLERRAVAAATRASGLVVALGGGAILDPENVDAIRRSGVVVYLAAPLATLFARGERTAYGRRPLWSGATRGQRLRAVGRLLKARRPLYREAAHIALRAGRGAPSLLAERVEHRLKSYDPTR